MKKFKMPREARIAYLAMLAYRRMVKFGSRSSMERHFKLRSALFNLRGY